MGAGHRILVGGAQLSTRERMRPGAVLARHLFDLADSGEGGHGILGAAYGQPVRGKRNVGGRGDGLLVKAARGRGQRARADLVGAVWERSDVEAVLQHGVGAHGVGERSGVQVRAVQGSKFVAGGASGALLAPVDAGGLGARVTAGSGGAGVGRAGRVAGAEAVRRAGCVEGHAQTQVSPGG